MWPFTGAFDDPRWRRERQFLYLFLPGVLLVLTVLILVFFWKDLFPPPPGSMRTSETVHTTSEPAPEIEKPAAPAAPPIVSNTTKGLEALQKKDRVGARIFIDAALRENPADASAQNLMGIVEFEEKNMDKALVHFSEAIRLDGTRPEYWLGRSEVLREQQRPKDAMPDLEAARKLDRLNPLYANKILLTRLEAGDTPQVVREVQTAIDLNVTQSQSDWLAGAAGIEIEAGNTGRALEFLDALRKQTDAKTFKLIVTDRFFKSYTDRPGFSRFLPTPTPQP